jgi:hypothetical protein
MSKEALQFDMFTGELVDNRTATQKKKEKEQAKPQQAEMFSQREMAQFGVKAHPKLPISPKTRLELMIEDHRTDEEKAEAIQREALERNYRLFEEESNPILGAIESTPASELPTESLE